MPEWIIAAAIACPVGVIILLWSSNNKLWDKVDELEKRINELELQKKEK